MADATIIDTMVTGSPMMVTGIAAMMVPSTEITEITTITMEETVIAMDCGGKSKILEVSS
jgi:hypothetical protein